MHAVVQKCLSLLLRIVRVIGFVMCGLSWILGLDGFHCRTFFCFLFSPCAKSELCAVMIYNRTIFHRNFYTEDLDVLKLNA